MDDRELMPFFLLSSALHGKEKGISLFHPFSLSSPRCHHLFTAAAIFLSRRPLEITLLSPSCLFISLWLGLQKLF